MSTTPPIAFDNSYARLPEQFYSEQAPAPVSKPTLIRINHALAEALGINAEWLASEQGVAAMAGNHLPEGAEPIACAYAGHQFGSWNPQLGDGRAVLLGEVLGGGQRYDIQLKGAGRGKWSRGGDGRSPLGPVLREYLLSEAMHALGVPSSRSLAAVLSGDQVVRDSFLPGAVLCRVASSHIRIGTFQYFAARRDMTSLQLLAEHVIQRHYPQAAEADQPILALLDLAIAKQAELVAAWQLVGFIHGVMNTDNMLLCGETIDYGPCAFMDSYNPAAVFSSIDHGGRYAYQNQPAIAHWNLMQLAQCLIPLLDEDQDKAVELAQQALNRYPDRFGQAYRQGLNRKLGFQTAMEGDDALSDAWFKLLEDESLDFTLSFRWLAENGSSELSQPEPGAGIRGWYSLPDAAQPWLQRWRQRLASEAEYNAARQPGMLNANPAIIPRNHRVEACIAAAEQENDFSAFHAMLDAVCQPYHYDDQQRYYASAPRPDERVHQTFCGT